MDWRLRRKRDLLAQKKYAEDHQLCEVCGRPGMHVHEILFRSKGGKCVEENMITLCLEDHDRSHRKKKPYLTREELFEIKKGEKTLKDVRIKEGTRKKGGLNEMPTTPRPNPPKPQSIKSMF